MRIFLIKDFDFSKTNLVKICKVHLSYTLFLSLNHIYYGITSYYPGKVYILFLGFTVQQLIVSIFYWEMYMFVSIILC